MTKVRERLQLKLEQKKIQREKEASNLSTQCRIALDNKQYRKAVEFGEKALKLIPEGDHSSIKDGVLHNMGVAYQTFDTFKALKCFEELEKGYPGLTPLALQMFPILKNVIMQKAICQVAIGDFKGAKDSISKVGGAMDKIINLQIQLNDKTVSIQEIYNESLEIQTNSDQEKINLTLLQAAIYSYQGNTDMVINSIKTLSDMATKSSIEDLIIKSIKGFRIGGKFTEGMDFLNYAKKNYPAIEKSNNLSGLYDLFIIHENTDNYDLATNYLIKLQELTNLDGVEKTTVKLANTVRFYTELEKKNFEAAKKILKETDLEFTVHNKMLSKLKEESFAEQKQVLKVKASDDVLSNAIIEAEINNNTSSVSKIEDKCKDEPVLEIAEINPADFDPKKLHEYFKHKKSLVSKKSLEDKGSQASSWVLPNGTKYDSEQTDIVHKIEGREHYYICIKNNLKLGSEFIDAMKKGIVSIAKAP